MFPGNYPGSSEAESLARKHRDQEPVHRTWTPLRFYTELLAFSAEVRGETVLDVGCGLGQYTDSLLALGFSAVGIDLSLSLVEEAQRRVPQATFMEMSPRRLQFEPRSFAGVWCALSFEHTPRLAMPEIIAGLARVMEPDAVLGLIMPVRQNAAGDFLESEELLEVPREGGTPVWAWTPSPATLQNLFEAGGFRMLASETKTGPEGQYVFQLYRR